MRFSTGVSPRLSAGIARLGAFKEAFVPSARVRGSQERRLAAAPALAKDAARHPAVGAGRESRPDGRCSPEMGCKPESQIFPAQHNGSFQQKFVACNGGMA